MKVPKKLYLFENPINGIPDDRWLSKRSCSDDVEYIRTDAFIEKACNFFEENIKEEDCKIGSSEWIELRAEYKSLDSFIRAFVGFMKEE